MRPAALRPSDRGETPRQIMPCVDALSPRASAPSENISAHLPKGFQIVQRRPIDTFGPAPFAMYRRPHPRLSLRFRSTRGFTLVELAVVTTIIAVVAALALPAMQRLLVSTRAGAVVNDLRVFSGAFQSYEHQNGSYPPEAAVGVLPPLMVGQLGNTAWLRTTPIGGRYNWDFNVTHGGTRYRASIGLRTLSTNRVSSDTRQLLAIDRAIDNGVLTSGNFFLGAGNEPVFIIER